MSETELARHLAANLKVPGGSSVLVREDGTFDVRLLGDGEGFRVTVSKLADAWTERMPDIRPTSPGGA